MGVKSLRVELFVCSRRVSLGVSFALIGEAHRRNQTALILARVLYMQGNDGGDGDTVVSGCFGDYNQCLIVRRIDISAEGPNTESDIHTVSSAQYRWFIT